MNVCDCFELNGVDAPILRGIKSYARALAWRNADPMNHYFVLFTLDAEPEVSPPRDLQDRQTIMSSNEPKRPYYLPPQRKPNKAIVIPVGDWSIAGILFLNGKKKSTNEHATAARK